MIFHKFAGLFGPEISFCIWVSNVMNNLKNGYIVFQKTFENWKHSEKVKQTMTLFLFQTAWQSVEKIILDSFAILKYRVSTKF